MYMKKYIVMFIFIVVASFIFIESVSAEVKVDPSKSGNQSNQVKVDPQTSGQVGSPIYPKTTEIDKLEDPLGEGVSIEGLLLKLFDIILYVGVPIVAFFLIWSGFMFVTAQGKPEQIETAKSRLLSTLVGAALLLGAWTISQAISGTLKDIKNGASTTKTTK